MISRKLPKSQLSQFVRHRVNLYLWVLVVSRGRHAKIVHIQRLSKLEIIVISMHIAYQLLSIAYCLFYLIILQKFVALIEALCMLREDFV